VSGIRERRDLTPKQKDKILGLNAAKLLKLYQLAGGAFQQLELFEPFERFEQSLRFG
jgi:hypothetical protein